MLRGARGSRVRTRGGLSRGSYNSNTYSFRSDSNTFEVLSSMPQDGDAESFFSGARTGFDDDGFTLIRKRQRRSTGGTSNDPLLTYNPDLDPDPNIMSNFEEMGTDDKLSAIFSTLTCNQNRIKHIEQNVRKLAGFNGRLERVETVLHSYNDRLRLLEYKSIDLEARSRRNNLLFKGFPETRDENCRRTVLDFLEAKLRMEELPSIERVHRLGRYNSEKGPRPIIVAFSFYKDTEDILSLAHMLKGTPYGISRDYPQEITHARQKLWPQYKAARENPLNRVTIGYPAKLIVNGVVVCDLFPEWNSVNKGSRISLIKQGDNQSDPIHNHSGLTRPTYAEVVNSATNGQHHNNSQSDALTSSNSVLSPSSFEERMDTHDVDSQRSSPSMLAGAEGGTDFETDLFVERPLVKDCDYGEIRGNLVEKEATETVADPAPKQNSNLRVRENQELRECRTQTDLCSSPSALADRLIRSSSNSQLSDAAHTSGVSGASISKSRSPEIRTSRSASRNRRAQNRPRPCTRSRTPVEKKSNMNKTNSSRTTVTPTNKQ